MQQLNRTLFPLLLVLILVLVMGCSETESGDTIPTSAPDNNPVRVELSWNTDADLDLEIWTETPDGYNYLADASNLMNAPDVTSGFQGDEWFEFRETRDYDFTQGQWIISPCFYELGSSGQETTDVTLTLTIGDSTETFTKQLKIQEPNNQWLAVKVNMDDGTWEVIDTFADVSAPSSGSEVRVELSWDTDADLDLEIWTESTTEFSYLADASDLMDSPDITNGFTGSEWFEFRETQEYDFTRSTWVISPFFYEIGDSGIDTANVTLTLTMDGEVQTFTKQLSYSEPYDQWIAIRVNMDLHTWELIDRFAKEQEDTLITT